MKPNQTVLVFKQLMVNTTPQILVGILPKVIACDCEKLPLGLAPPTIRILPFPPSSDGINVQVWPTLTPGALPLGIKEYLLKSKHF